MKATKGLYTIPAARRATVNATLAAQGLGEDFFSVPLIKGNGTKITHYAASASMLPWQQAAFDAAVKSEGNTTANKTVAKLGRAAFKAELAKHGMKVA